MKDVKNYTTNFLENHPFKLPVIIVLTNSASIPEGGLWFGNLYSGGNKKKCIDILSRLYPNRYFMFTVKQIYRLA
ncbi:MAG: hypothetical protein HC905_22550 [Bacteroidales bacterium]|nr:hypothetical protein [Bacteroidales bacterium]